MTFNRNFFRQLVFFLNINKITSILSALEEPIVNQLRIRFKIGFGVKNLGIRNFFDDFFRSLQSVINNKSYKTVRLLWEFDCAHSSLDAFLLPQCSTTDEVYSYFHRVPRIIYIWKIKAHQNY